MAFNPTIPGELAGRNSGDAEINRLESQEARRLSLPRPDLNRIALVGESGAPFANGLLVSSALVTGSNTVAHGLGRAPVGCVVVADDAVPVYVYAFRSGAQSVTGTATVELNDDTNGDWQGNFNTSTYTFTAPHAGLYFADCALGFDSVAADVYVYGALICSTFGTLSFGEASGRGDAIRWGSNLIIPLVLNETVYMSASVESGTEGMTVGKDDTRLVIRSDETLVVPSYDATNLTIYSARSRTASFWVW